MSWCIMYKILDHVLTRNLGQSFEVFSSFVGFLEYNVKNI